MSDMSVHFSSVSDCWETPTDLFSELNDKFGFTLDPCCFKETAKCSKFYTKEDDGLTKDWSRDVVFMNPPYGRSVSKWVKKAYEESLKGATVVCLIPSRTDTTWWHDFCMKGEVTFIKGRLKFDNRALPSWRADGSHKKSPAPFPSAIVVFKGESNE